MYKRHELFVYLGKPITVAGETENQAKDILKGYQKLLESVTKCQLPLALKLEALESVMSKIQHHFQNTNISEELPQEFDKALTSFLRHLFDIYTNATVRTCYMRKQLDGLKPSIVYRTIRINPFVKMLNHVDDNIRYVARKSLELDMKKRGVKRTTRDPQFLGYQCKEDGKLKTNVKGGFGVISDWPHLCTRLMS